MVQDIRTVKNMIKQLLYVLTPEQKRKSVLLFFIIVIGSAFETLGISAIMPFIQALLTPEVLMEKWYVKLLAETLNLKDSVDLIICLGVAIIFIYIVKNLYLAFSAYFQTNFRYRFQKELSIKVFKSYMKRPYQYFTDINSSEILRGIGGDVIGVFGTFEGLFKMLSEIMTVIFIGAFLFVTDAVLAGGILLIGGIAFLVIVKGFKRLLTGAGEKARNASVDSTKYAYQAAMGIKEIKVMDRQDYFVDKYEMSYEQFRKAEQKNSFLNLLPERVIETVCVGGLLGIVCLRVLLGVDTAVFVPKLAAFAMAAFRILPSISRMIGYIAGLIYQRPNLEAAYNNIKEVEKFEKSYDRIKNEIIDKKSFINEIKINGLYWRYNPNSDYVLKNLFLTIKRGESVGLIGKSGSGKTTLMDILLGLFEPEKGKIEVDNVNIFSIKHEWANLIGYVPQTVFLTDDTLRNNIAFGVKEELIKDEDVWKALELAQLKDFVETLPEKLDTIVGERGIKFSGGQRQRVAIARALYYNPDILVLDEATAALDGETEKAVMDSIEALQGYKTLIIVAHRLTTIKNCDKVYEIKDGIAVKKDVKELL